MPAYQAPIKHQRMRSNVVQPNAVALLGVYALIPAAVEGALLKFVVKRSRSVESSIRFKFTLSSSSSAADFKPGTIIGNNVTMARGQFEYTINAQTVVRAGDQGLRSIICTIEALDACEIDPAHATAITSLDDEVDPGTEWFKALPYRSNKPFAAGVSYFQNAPNTWRQYETECQEIDGFNGDHFGSTREFISTWDRVQGGPLGNSASILANGQLGWNSQSTHFSVPFREVPVNTCWAWFNFTVVPEAYNTTLAGNRSKIWDEINAGTHDQRFTEFGARIASLFAARGIDLDYFIGCMCPRPQTSLHYRVYADTKIKFRDAFNRVAGLMRTGAAKPDLRFCMSFSFHKTYEGENYGTLESWFPSAADVIGMVFHPNAAVTNRTSYDSVVNGNANYYGITSELLALARTLTKPIAFPEWSPRWESCPIANDVYNWFHDEVLVPNAPIIVGANIYHNNTFNPNAADAQGAAAAASWANGVSTFKGLFGDGGTLPQAVVGIENNATTSVTEGNTINFTVRRNTAASQACSVRWTAASSRNTAADLTGAITGIVSFAENDGITSKTVSVSTVNISGDQGDRTITVTLSAPTNCTLDGTKLSAARTVVDRATVTVNTRLIYLTPFSKQSAHRRPFGGGGIWQVQGGYTGSSAPNNTSTYRANQGPVFTQGMKSPLVQAYDGLNNSGFFGQLRLAPGDGQVKAFFYVPTGDATKIRANKPINITNTNFPDINIDWPLLDYEGFDTEQPLFIHTGAGEANVMVYPRDALESVNATMVWFFNMANNAAADNTTSAGQWREWKLNGLDWDVNNDGGGGSGALFPTGVLRGRPFIEAGDGIANIGHALHMEVTRRNSDGANSVSGTNNPKTSIMLGRDLIIPAVKRDSNALNAEEGPSANWPEGRAWNIGFLPYGGLLGIPEWFRPVRDSTTANPVTITGHGTFALNLSNIGKALFDCLRKHGVRPLDGSFEAVGPNSAYARMSIRVDQAVSKYRLPGTNERLYDHITNELAKICPPRPAAGASLTRWEQCLLYPFAGMRDYATENGADGSGGYWVGGGGPKYTDSVNTGLF